MKIISDDERVAEERTVAQTIRQAASAYLRAGETSAGADGRSNDQLQRHRENQRSLYRRYLNDGYHRVDVVMETESLDDTTPESVAGPAMVGRADSERWYSKMLGWFRGSSRR